MSQKILENILEVLALYLKDDLLYCNVDIKPDYFSIYNRSHLNNKIRHNKIEQKVRPIISQKHYLEYCPIKGVVLWEKLSHANILAFKSTEKNPNEVLEIKKLDIRLNSKEGFLKNIKSNHDKIEADGYINNIQQVMNMPPDYHFLYSDYGYFIRLEHDTLFYYKEMRDIDILYQSSYLSFAVIPNKLINIDD